MPREGAFERRRGRRARAAAERQPNLRAIKSTAVARGLQNPRQRLGIVDRLAGREAPQAGCRDPSRLRILPATRYRTVSTIPAWARTSERRSRTICRHVPKDTLSRMLNLR